MILNEMNDSINNQTTDKGWTAMQKLLDQEMPTEQKRRRFIWWWLFVLILPLAAYGGWRLTLTPSVTPWQPVESKLAPVGRLPMAQLPEATEKPKNQPETIPSSDAIRHLPTDRNLLAHTNSPLYTVSGKEALLTENTEYTSRINSASAGNETLPETPLSANSTTQHSEIIHTEPITKTIQLLPVYTAKFPLDLLAIPIRPVENPGLTVAKSPSIVTDDLSGSMIKTRKKSPQWSFGITAALGTERFQAVNSIAGGLAADWQTGSRWGIRSGLLYKKYKPSSFDQPVALVQPSQYEQAVNSYYDVTDLTGNVSTPTSGGVALQETVIIPVSSLSIIELPMLASWRVARPIKLFAGWSTGYVVAAETAVKSFSGQYSLKANNDQAINNLNSLAVNDIQRWRFDLQTGLSIQLGKRVEIGLLAQLPLRKATAKNDSLGSFNPNVAGESIQTKNHRLPFFTLQATCFLKSVR